MIRSDSAAVKAFWAAFCEQTGVSPDVTLWPLSSRLRDYSWTTDLERAKWFAQRFASILPDPGVYETVVSVDHVLFYTVERMESEFFCRLDRGHKVTRVWRA